MYVLFSNLSFPLIVIVLDASAVLPAPVVTVHVIVCFPILNVLVFVIIFFPKKAYATTKNLTRKIRDITIVSQETSFALPVQSLITV